MEKKVVGAVGKNGTGKDTVLDMIADKYGVPTISMGDIVREIGREKGIELSRENLNAISAEYFEKHGKDYFIKQVCDRIDASDAPLTLVTGIRTYLDAKTLSDRYHADFSLVNVIVSDDKARLERALARATARDPKTLEEMAAHDAREEKIFGLDKAAELATHTMRNDGSLDDLQGEVDRWVAKEFPWLEAK